MNYSLDRISLAQEITATLRLRGYWVPKDWAGPDLINAVSHALNQNEAIIKGLQREIINAKDRLETGLIFLEGMEKSTGKHY